MSTSHQLGPLQLAIMRVLWRRGESTVAAVHEDLINEVEPRALTTIATMLAKMEKKGVVAHHSEGRQFVYHATVSEPEVQRSMVGELMENLFAGDAAALVNHLLVEREFEPSELERLKRLIAATEQQRAGGSSDER